MQTSNQTIRSEQAVRGDDYHHGKTLGYVLGVLGVFFVLGVWIMQNSLNAYYLQTYHKESPLMVLQGVPVWDLGGKVGDTLYQYHGQFTDAIVAGNQQVVDYFNEHYAYTPEYKAKVVEQARLAAEQAKIAAEQAAAAELKSQYTLSISAGDEIFFAGDSMMQGVAPHTQQFLQKTHNIKSVNLSKQSTGLAYPSFFNWPKTIEETLATNPKIKILAVFLGPNDPWNMPNLNGGGALKYGTPEWDAGYRERMAMVLNTAKNYGVKVIWMTPPNMKKASLNEQMIHLNEVMQAELKLHNALIIDTRELVGGSNNVYNDYLVKDGESIKMRSSDGIHFTVQGQKLLAKALEEQLTIVP